MRVRAANALPVGVMLLLAALTLWLQAAVEDPGISDGGTKRHDPDAVIENFTVTRLGAEGQPAYILSAQKLFHFPDDDSSEVLFPRVVHVAPGEGNMTATADRGLLTKEGDEGFFYDNVLLVREAKADKAELRVRTDFLHVLNEKGLARTDRAVTITEGSSKLYGVGMELHKDTTEFKLFSRVRGTYDAPKK
jgi:lipopolysaccharide export system protein LptC